MGDRAYSLLAALFIVVFAGRVAATHRVFNDTIDEADHIEAGLEFLERGVYAYEPQHPPLARLAVAAGPYYLAGLRLTEERRANGKIVRKPLDRKRLLGEEFLWGGAWRRGSPEAYWRTLALARMGTLVFAVVLLAAVFCWTSELFDPRAGAAAVLIASCSPTILAHSGLATVDAAAAAFTVLSAYLVWRWMRNRRIGDAAAAGMAAALAVTSKLSAPAWLPLIFAGLFLLERRGWQPRAFVRQAALLAAVAAALVWAVYGFDTGPIAEPGEIYISDHEKGTPAPSARRVAAILGSTPLPAPRLFQGILDVMAHNAGGHASYLLGEWSNEGRRLYFPVAVGVKTTLPLLALAGWGLAAGLRNHDKQVRKYVLAAALPGAAALAVAMAANINIGVRHLLPLYPSLAMLAAVPFTGFRIRAGNWKVKTLAPLALLAWHAGESIAAHPDYLAYFNEVARGREHEFLLDSNLDWGQDLARLSDWMREAGAPAVILRYFGHSDPEKLGVNTFILPASDPNAGWFAISANFLFGMEGSSDALRRLRARRPAARVGKSIWVYRITPGELGGLAPPWFFENYRQSAPPGVKPGAAQE